VKKPIKLPRAYQEGKAHFFELELVIKRGIFIPRPETEELVELALNYLPLHQKISILDLGSGCGAIALTLAKRRPEACVLGIEKNPLALQTARLNQGRLGIENLSFRKGDLFQSLQERFDFLVANLPYLPYDACHIHPSTYYEPKEALFAPRYGTAFIKQALDQLHRYIKKAAFFEIDPCTAMILANDLKKLPKVSSYEFRKDLCGKTRFLIVQLRS